MKNYLQIATKIRSTPWLCTEEGLHVIMSVFNEHVKNGKLSDDELVIKLNNVEMRGGNSREVNYDVKGDIGILPLNGPIFGKANLMTQLSGATSLETFQDDLSAMLNDPDISSIIMQIDSPGGTSDLVEETGNMIRAGRDVKPIYALADTMCGSAALWLMCQATGTYSTLSGSVGSLGAYTVHEDQSVADAQEGIKYTFISAGPYKTEGNPHEPLSQAGAEFRQERIDALYTKFVDNVAQGRNLSAEHVIENFGGGRMLPAEDALAACMIDGITTMNGLIQQIASKPVKTQFAINGKTLASSLVEVMKTGDDPNKLEAARLIINLVDNKLEVAGWEHSEPGSGPAERQQDPPEDPAIAGGWRKSPLPLGKDDEGAPQAKSTDGRNKMNEEQLKQLFEMYKVDSEEALMAAITAEREELTVLKTKVAGDTDKDKLFAEQFPEQYARNQSLMADKHKRDAKDFVASISTIKRQVGEDQVDTKLGLSSLAIETIEKAHEKFAMNMGNLNDFENCMTAITVGIVNFEEVGSSREVDIADIDTSNMKGIADARAAFAAKVAKIQIDDPNIGIRQATDMAAKLHPQLWAAYNSPMHAK